MRVQRSLVILIIISMLLALAGSCVWAVEKGSLHSSEKIGSSEPKADKGEDYLLGTYDAATDKEDKANDTPIYVTVLRFIFNFALVLGLIYVTILGLKKYSNIKSVIGPGQNRIRVLENSSLGANKALHLIEIGSRKLLVASTPSQINLLAELSDEDLPEMEVHEQQPKGFKDQLAMFMGAKTDSTESAKSVAQMLHDSTGLLQDKVREIGTLRRKLKDEDTD